MEKLEPIMERRNYNGTPLKRVSWASVFSGAFAGVATMLTLAMLAVAIGVVDMASSSGWAWLVISALAMFTGGWTAGRLCGLRRRLEGTMHGFVTWAFATVTLLLLAGPLSFAAVGGFYGPPETPRVVAPTVSIEMDGTEDVRADIENLAHDLLGKMDLSDQDANDAMEQLRPHLDALIIAVARRPMAKAEYERATAREKIVTLLASRTTDMTRAGLEAEVDSWIEMAAVSGTIDTMRGKRSKKRHKRWERAQQRQHPILQQSRTVAGWSFLFLAIGAAAAMLGGAVGAPTRGRRSKAAPPMPRTEPPSEPPGSETSAD